MPRLRSLYTPPAAKKRRGHTRTPAMPVPVPYSPDLRRSRVFHAALAAAVLAATVWVALPAYASCSNSASIGWQTSGSVIRGSTTAQCSPEFVTYARVRTQEKVAGVWATRTWSQWSGNSHGITGYADANCAGHGQDLWRAQGYYESSLGGSATAYSPPGSQGAWFNCP